MGILTPVPNRRMVVGMEARVATQAVLKVLTTLVLRQVDMVTRGEITADTTNRVIMAPNNHPTQKALVSFSPVI